ncbi:MAG: hypothetical protein IJQ93_02895 [Bacteroidales bacterium]|nr:hypothetical protein [Bacteroidales bacterium]
MATDTKKPVDLEGLGAAIDKIKGDFAKKEDIPAMNFATREEVLALFEDATAETGASEGTDSGDGAGVDDNV